MTTYAFFMTWLVGFIMGGLALFAALIYFTIRGEKAQRAKDQADMDAACDLVNETLGATILTYQE